MKYNQQELMTDLWYSTMGFKALVESIFERIENPNSTEHIINCIDTELIYYEDQWEVLKHYCDPQYADWNQAIDNFVEDILNWVEKYKEK